MITLKRNGVYVDTYESEYIGRSIVIAIDSSKSNSAIMVGDAFGHILNDYEISGAGSDVNVYNLCQYTRDQLKILFNHADIMLVGIENIITKKEAGYNGIEIHQSRYKITAVFDNFIFTFQEFFHVMPELIDNWSWKSTILPADYRSRAHKKGSKDYLKAIGSTLGSRADDVTDAFCIYKYLIKRFEIRPTTRVTYTMPTNKKFTWGIYPESTKFPKADIFEICNSDTLENNIRTVVELARPGVVSIFKWPIEQMSLDMIYSGLLFTFGNAKYTRLDKNVIIEVKADG